MWFIVTDYNNPQEEMLTFGRLANSKEGRTICDRHANPELTYIKSGRGVFCVAGVDYSFSGGEIFMVFRGESHYFKKYDSESVIYNLNFDIRFIYNYDFSFGVKHVGSLMSDNELGIIKYVLEKNEADELSYEFDKIEKELKGKGISYESAVRLHLMNIILCLFRAIGTDSGKFYSNNVNGILRAMDYITRHFSEKLTLTEIAQAAHLSPSYFGQVFKKITGLTPWDYVNSKRISYAVNLLKEGNSSLTDIAFSCGFNNLTNFTNIFKKVTGYTPRVYARENIHDIYK